METSSCPQFSIREFLVRVLPKLFLMLILLLLGIDQAKAENPYQQALKQQRQLEEEQRYPVGPLGITPSQLQTQRALELESQMQQQQIQNLQYEINRIKRKQQEREEQDYNQ